MATHPVFLARCRSLHNLKSDNNFIKESSFVVDIFRVVRTNFQIAHSGPRMATVRLIQNSCDFTAENRVGPVDSDHVITCTCFVK
jgi:hypothetical protein